VASPVLKFTVLMIWAGENFDFGRLFSNSPLVLYYTLWHCIALLYQSDPEHFVTRLKKKKRMGPVQVEVK
jgi:hypothetical protein